MKHDKHRDKLIVGALQTALCLVMITALILTGCESAHVSSGTGASAVMLTSMEEAALSESAATSYTSDAVLESGVDISIDSSSYDSVVEVTIEDGAQSSSEESSTFTVAGSPARTFYVEGTPAVVSDSDSKDDDSMNLNGQSSGADVSVTELVADNSTDESQKSSESSDNNSSDKSSQESNKDSNSGNTQQTQSKTVASETGDVTYGIDVASYQGVINWQKVAASGVGFAMVRVGYRSNDGVLHEDANARYNLQEANKYGIKTGAYFFSRATSQDEAIQEANLCISIISGYSITYPVAYNCEGYNKSTSRQYGISMQDRSSYAQTFLSTVKSAGYTPMFYASRNELAGGTDWDTASLAGSNKIWLAYYPSDPSVTSPGYSGSYCMWQYTSKGSVPGIEGNVDIDIAYFGYSGTSSAKSDTATESVTANMESGMTFTEVNETVTCKDVLNLRDRPSQGEASVVVAKIKNGETVTRTGYNETTGWSRVIYNGQTLYCVSSYLIVVE
ncbi:GH25 family lysozyme [Butyrivibrio fibrisolvens]|uniref:GH25 family lysozyme n=1 Tax=Butyrivibrio fibrisolvens TaxID=831 RepID=UPI00068853A3|nr:GH25 family lysozyme [Butyrivibrio fibrisolvens]